MTTDPLARSGAEAIRLAFELYRRQFQRITVKARRRFEERDWVAGQLDAAERLELYRLVSESALHSLQRALGERIRRHPLPLDRSGVSRTDSGTRSERRGHLEVEIVPRVRLPVTP